MTTPTTDKRAGRYFRQTDPTTYDRLKAEGVFSTQEQAGRWLNEVDPDMYAAANENAKDNR